MVEISDKEYQQIQVRLRAAEEASRMVTVVRDSNDAITIQNFEGQILAWNRGAELMFGYSEQEALKMTIWQLAPPEKAAEQKDFNRRIFAGEKVSSFETQRLTKDGRLLDVWLTVTKLVDEAGKVIGIASTERDITERKQSEEKYRLLVEQARDGIVIIQDSLVKYCNVRLAKIWGGELEEIVDKIFIDFIYPSERPKINEWYQQRMAGKELPGIYETVVLKKDGTKLAVELNAVITNYQGKVADLVIIRDISERKQVEKELIESEKEFRSMAEAMPQIVWSTRPDGYNIYFNQKWIDYTGLTQEESRGDGWNKPFYPDDQKRAWDAWKNATQCNGKYSIECRLRRADGAYRWFLVRGEPMTDADGKIIKWFGTCTDIEDLKQAEEILKKSEEEFRAIFDNAGDGILLAEMESKKFFMGNNAICKMLGYSPEELKILGVMDIHPEKDIPYVIDQFERQLKGEFSLSRDMPVKKKDGTVFYADINATTITIAEKTYLLVFFRDITERKGAEELRKSREVAEAANRAKSDFLANMSHELRTPLNSIIGFSEVLYDQVYGPLNEKQKDYLNDVLTSSQHLMSLINDILDLSKIESGKMELVLATFSLKELLEGSFILIKEKALKHNINLSSEIPDDVDGITADERKVKQIVYNLLANAIKFTPDGGKMGVRARKIDGQVEVAVWDTGIGIASENQGKLFNKFCQLTNPFDKKIEGSGLELSLVKSLIELHGGKIWVQSEGKDKGATFTFTLPITPPPPRKPYKKSTGD